MLIFHLPACVVPFILVFGDFMRITDVREVTLPIASPIANAYIDFSKMTCSLVAVVTDVVREGRPVIGYGFNSNGRYGQGGLIRERFAPRLREASPASLLQEDGQNFDPDRIWKTLMRNEKPGGHGERSVAVGTIDMAVWDAVAKISGKPLFRLLAERYGCEANPRVFVYAAGGYYYPGKNLDALRAEMRSYVDRGYTVVKMKVGGAPLREDRQRIEAVLAEIGSQAQLAVDANGRFDLVTAIEYARMLREFPLFWYEEAGDPLDYALQAALAEFFPVRWRPVKTSSVIRTPAICCVTAACAHTAIGFSSIAPCPTASANTFARSESSRQPDGRRAAASPTGVTRCRSTSRRDLDSAAMKATRISFSHSEASPIASASRTVTSPCRSCRGSDSKARPTSSRSCESWRSSDGPRTFSVDEHPETAAVWPSMVAACHRDSPRHHAGRALSALRRRLKAPGRCLHQAHPHDARAHHLRNRRRRNCQNG
jgi:L-alanine-DL-glutamate epimerase-like enolase superfamily enzyme